MRLAQTSKDAPPSGVEVKKAHRLWEPTLQAVRTVANVPHRKLLACSRAAGLHDEALRDQAGLDCVRPRVEPAGDQKEDLSATGPGQNKTRGTGFRTRSERRKRAKLRKFGQGPRHYKQCLPGRHRDWRRPSRL
ncbi:hypothetical protein PR003_g34606 [Phytophthora rubi]|uniref:Uncharacterized protein n=1 Tax=Phytophthora rubi TaxID=129364 RepID=A0A6A4AKF8_9STRA|nr:hypothetical protein PR003_g34606 [Phytophthora rubi]